MQDHGYGIRFALEPKPNEPRGDILLPTVGHALAFIASLEHHEMVGLNPEVGHEQMAGLNFAHGIAQALWHGKLFHIDLNGQRGIKFDQDLVFGHGDLINAFSLVDLLEFGGPGGRARLRRAAALRLQAITDRGQGRRVGLGGGEHAHVPAAQGAGGRVPRRSGRASRPWPRAGWRSSRTPTLAPGETHAGLLADRSAFEDFDADAAGAPGYGFVRLNQLAIEHLLRAR